MNAVQAVRLVDVFLLGPVMIYSAAKADTLPAGVRLFLGFSGAATIVFNAVRYIENAKD